MNLYIDVIKGSNITYLVYETVRSRGKSLEPVGWDKFVTGLALINVPEYLVGSPNNRATIQDIEALGKPGNDLDKKSFPTSNVPVTRSKLNRDDKLQPLKRTVWEKL